MKTQDLCFSSKHRPNFCRKYQELYFYFPDGAFHYQPSTTQSKMAPQSSTSLRSLPHRDRDLLSLLTASTRLATLFMVVLLRVTIRFRSLLSFRSHSTSCWREQKQPTSNITVGRYTSWYYFTGPVFIRHIISLITAW